MKKVMITGGAGFIGSNLTGFLLDETDWDVKMLDNLESGSFERVEEVESYDEGRVEMLEGDIRDEDAVKGGVKGCDYVVNLAAQVGVVPSIEDPRYDLEVNIQGLINLLEAAKKNKVERFVHASSAAPLGDVEPPVSEEDVPRPMSPYGASKLAGEGYCSAYAHSFGLNTIALRFSNVYGPESVNKTSVVHKFIKRILRGKKLEVYGDGEQTRDYIHVDDICGGILSSLSEDLNGFELIQLGTGEETSVNELVEILKKISREVGLDFPGVVHQEARDGEILRNFTDISKAREVLNFQPSVSLEDGVEKTFKWYLNQKREN